MASKMLSTAVVTTSSISVKPVKYILFMAIFHATSHVMTVKYFTVDAGLVQGQLKV
jgi:hypothetical protein